MHNNNSYMYCHKRARGDQNDAVFGSYSEFFGAQLSRQQFWVNDLTENSRKLKLRTRKDRRNNTPVGATKLSSDRPLWRLVTMSRPYGRC